MLGAAYSTGYSLKGFTGIDSFGSLANMKTAGVNRADKVQTLWIYCMTVTTYGAPWLQPPVTTPPGIENTAGKIPKL